MLTVYGDGHTRMFVEPSACRQAAIATVDEVAGDIFRISVALPGAPVTFSFFVIRGEQPTLVETGFRRTSALPTPRRSAHR